MVILKDHNDVDFEFWKLEDVENSPDNLKNSWDIVYYIEQTLTNFEITCG